MKPPTKTARKYGLTLGLDISTSVIGICVLDVSGNIVKLDYLSLKSTKDLFEKVNLFKEKIISLTQEYPIKKVAVEAALLGFMGGKSSVHTRTLLCEFNVLCRYVIQEHFEGKLPVVLVNRQSVIAFLRKRMGWSISGSKQKDQIVNHFLDAKLYDFPFKPRAKDKVIEESADMIDAWCAALYLASSASST